MTDQPILKPVRGLRRWFRAALLVWRCQRAGHRDNSIVGHPLCEHYDAFTKLYSDLADKS